MASVVIAGDTSGTVTLAAPAVAGTTTLTLPTANGTVITTGSSGQSIPKAALPTGSVLQVVNVAYSTTQSTTSGTLADTGLSASITPTSSSSKILVLIDHCGCRVQPTTSMRGAIVLLRGSTQILVLDTLVGFTGTTNNNAIGSVSANYLDSPATTSSVTYKTQFAVDSGSGTFYLNNSGSTGQPNSTITLMEIAA